MSQLFDGLGRQAALDQPDQILVRAQTLNPQESLGTFKQARCLWRVRNGRLGHRHSNVANCSQLYGILPRAIEHRPKLDLSPSSFASESFLMVFAEYSTQPPTLGSACTL